MPQLIHHFSELVQISVFKMSQHEKGLIIILKLLIAIAATPVPRPLVVTLLAVTFPARSQNPDRDPARSEERLTRGCRLSLSSGTLASTLGQLVILRLMEMDNLNPCFLTDALNLEPRRRIVSVAERLPLRNGFWIKTEEEIMRKYF